MSNINNLELYCIRSANPTELTDAISEIGYIKILCLEDGELKINIDFNEKLIKANDIVVINPLQLVTITDFNAPLKYTYLNIPSQFIHSILNEDIIFNFKNIINNTELLNLLINVYEIYNSQKSVYKSLQIVKSVLESLIILVDKYMIEKKTVDSSNQFKHKVLKQIIYNYKTITLTDLSYLMNLNSSYLSRLFKKTFNMNFHEFLIKYKLFKAIEEIITTNNNMTQVALNNGFLSYKVFLDDFKRYINKSPSDFRKKHRII